MPRILLVDDEELNLDLLQQELEDRDFDVVTAGDAPEARDRLAEQVPDLIILDIQMPGEDGISLCRSLNEEPLYQQIPVILCTANCADDEQVIAGLEAGAVDYVVKPVSPGVLLARINIQLQIKGLQDELREKNTALDRLARTDPLTGLANRRMLGRDQAEFDNAAAQWSTPVACLMLDIDQFKTINDTFGHCVGDYVLQSVAELLKTCAPPEALSIRYGGDEFACILQNTSLDSAMRLAEQIRHSVSTNAFTHGPPGLAITVSIGCATADQHPIDMRAVLDSADTALYSAKRFGRNCVRCDATEDSPDNHDQQRSEARLKASP